MTDVPEEIRFAKTQQWRIATAAITLLGAIFAVAHTLHPLCTVERVITTVLVTLVATFASVFLFSLQNHLSRKRLEQVEKLEQDNNLEQDNRDDDAWLRGAGVLAALVAAVIISAIVVVYSLWRGPPCS